MFCKVRNQIRLKPEKFVQPLNQAQAVMVMFYRTTLYNSKRFKSHNFKNLPKSQKSFDCKKKRPCTIQSDSNLKISKDLPKT